MRKHMTLIVLALMLVATAGVVAYDSVDEVITFPDSNLELAVRRAIYEQLGKETNGPIRKTDIEKIEHLGISSNSVNLGDPEHIINDGVIMDLTGLEHLTGLKGLMISGTEVRNFSSLSNLTNLEGLILHSNEVTDLAPLSALPNLEFLAVVQCQASDLSPLASIKSLSRLHLRDNQISDISPLTGLTNLISITLCENVISDLAPCRNLTNLINIDLDGNRITDTEPLSNLTGLRLLSLSENQISDIAPLSKLANLADLRLDNNQISDISPLLETDGLREVDSVQIGNGGTLEFGENGNGLHIRNNPLSAKSINEYIPQLEAMGIKVFWQEKSEE